MPAQQTNVTVRIRNLAFGGEGVGDVLEQDNGKDDLLGITAFVPFTAPGEVIRAKVLEEKKRFLRGELLEVLESDPERVTPPCSYFKKCGGCELQHLSYQRQLETKLEMIRGALVAGHVPNDAVEQLQPIFPSNSFGYRRRISLHIDANGKVGFYQAGSRSIVEISECLIAVPDINKVLPGLRAFGQAVRGKISSLQLETDAGGLIAILRGPYALTANERQLVLSAAKEHFANVLLLAGEERIGGFGREILDVPVTPLQSVQIPAGSFSQVNWEVNSELVKRVLEYLEPIHNQRVFDLYAGAGNFALPLAKAGAYVTAVEIDKRLVSLGMQSAARSLLEKRLTYVERSVEKFLSTSRYPEGADVVIADPPRSGLGAITPKIVGPKTFILISCHLASCVRDLRALTELGYRVEGIYPFDMFAQTSYVEVLSFLTRD